MIEAVAHWTNWATVVSAGVSVLTFGGAAYFTRIFVKNAGAHAQLAAKNEIIHTNEQSIEALEKRLTTLEAEFVKATTRIAELERELQVARAENEALRLYTAPEAIRHFEQILNDRTPRFDDIQATLNQIDEFLAKNEEIRNSLLDEFKDSLKDASVNRESLRRIEELLFARLNIDQG